MFGNYYGYPAMYPPTGAVPDNLAQLRTPYQPQNNAQANNGLLWVQGESGAKSFLVAPGQSVLLMDSENSRFYLKSADASGMPLPLRTFEYAEVGANKPEMITAPNEKFVTREEFEERLAQLMDKHSGEVKENVNE